MNALQRKFIAEVRRAEELERKITYIVKELKKDDVEIPDIYNIRTPNPREIIDLEAHLEKTENEIQELSENNAALYQNFIELSELKFVLERTHVSYIYPEHFGHNEIMQHSVHRISSPIVKPPLIWKQLGQL